MMKNVIITLAIALVLCCGINAQSSSCPVETCVGHGQSCSATNICGDSNNQCYSGICTTEAGAGSDCSNAPCQSGLLCNNNVCNKQFYAGASCSANSDCLTYDATGKAVTTCTNGKCVGLQAGANCSSNVGSCIPPAICGHGGVCVAPESAGSTCASSEECQFDLVCTNGQCQAATAIGGACNVSTSIAADTCVAAAVCVPSSQNGMAGTCTERFTGASGGLCSQSYADAYGFATQCGNNLGCSTPASGNTYGTCANIPASSLNSCDPSTQTGNSACNTGEVCICNSAGNGKGICINTFQNNPSIHDTYKNYVTCIAKCARDDYACLNSNCHNQICSYQSAKQNPNSASNCAKGNSNNNVWKFPGYLTCNSSGAYIQYSAVLLFFSCLVAFLF